MTRFTGRRSIKSVLAAILAVAFIGTVPSLASAAGPSNNFAGAPAVVMTAAAKPGDKINGFKDNGSSAGITTGYTPETDEPSHGGVPASASGWWKWTPTVSARTLITTCGSGPINSNPSYDTRLGVYTGSSVNDLNSRGENDDDPDPGADYHCGTSNGGQSSALSFSASQGVTYYIAIDGNGTGFAQLHIYQDTDRVLGVYVSSKGAGGGSVSSSPAGINDCRSTPATHSECLTTIPNGAQVTLTATPDAGSRLVGWSGSSCQTQTATTCQYQAFGEFNALAEFEKIPANDDIENARELDRSDVTSVTGSTLGATLQPSWSETGQPDTSAGSSVWYTWTSGSTSHPTTVDVCNPNGTQRVSVYDVDVQPALQASGSCRVRFTSGPDITYYITVDAHAPGDQEDFVLNLVSADPPANDDFSNAQLLTGDDAATSNENNSGATHEAGEPGTGGSGTTASLWYRWTAPADGLALFSTCDNNHPSLDTTLGVYTGTQIDQLTQLATNDNDQGQLTFCSDQSAVKIPVVQDTTYYVSVDSNYATTGDFGLVIGFSRDTHSIQVDTAGTGGGTVADDDEILSCDSTDAASTCAAEFDDNAPVTLTATPKAGSTFTGWSGEGCSGTGTCVVTPNGDVTVTATFALRRTLSYDVSGNGTGTIATQPDLTGPGCTATSCSSTRDEGTTVTLTPTPASGSTFTGWSGDCSGTGPCNLTLNSDKTATATFAKVKHTLTYSTTGAGAGTISSSPQLSGSNCTNTACSVEVDEGTVVTLTPIPSTGSQFGGWTADCSGTGKCQVTITRDTSVTATFTKLADPLMDLRVKYGKAKLNKKNGTAVIPVTVSGAASITLSGKGIKTRKATTTSAATVKFAINPTGKVKAKLKKSGTAKVSLKVTGSNSSSKAAAGLRVTLKQTKKRK